MYFPLLSIKHPSSSAGADGLALAAACLWARVCAGKSLAAWPRLPTRMPRGHLYLWRLGHEDARTWGNDGADWLDAVGVAAGESFDPDDGVWARSGCDPFRALSASLPPVLAVHA